MQCQQKNIPLVLQELQTITEEKLWVQVPPVLTGEARKIIFRTGISLYRHNNSLIELSSAFHRHSTTQRALYRIMWPHSCKTCEISSPACLWTWANFETCSRLSLSVHIFQKEATYREYVVLVEKRFEILSWLKRHNHLYHTIPSKISSIVVW